MKKGYALLLSVFLVVALAGIMTVSAAPAFNTVIAGKIYDSPQFETAGPIPGATVAVTCNGIQQDTTSFDDGTYSVTFTPDQGCMNTIASAFAEKGGVVSSVQNATVQDYTESLDLYLGVINIALIPEFGFGIGLLTLVSAIGIFFFVRKK